MLSIMGEGSVKAKTHLYVGILVCLFIITVALRFAHADSLTEQQMQEYVDATAEGMGLVTPRDLISDKNPVIQPAPPPIDQNNLTQDQKDKLAIAQGLKAGSLSAMCEGFEIYPDSMLCSQFRSHIETEQHYYHCSLNNYQLALRNGELEAKCGYGAPSASVCVDQGSIGAGNGLWKPTADPAARCKGGTTILLDQKYRGVMKLDILDSNKQFLSSTSYFGELEDGRPRFCAEGKSGASFGPVPLNLKYSFNGVAECRSVKNATIREE